AQDGARRSTILSANAHVGALAFVADWFGTGTVHERLLSVDADEILGLSSIASERVIISSDANADVLAAGYSQTFAIPPCASYPGRALGCWEWLSDMTPAAVAFIWLQLASGGLLCFSPARR